MSFGVTLRNIILCASTIPLLSLFITCIRVFYRYQPPFFPVLLYIYTKTSLTPNMQHLNGLSFISFYCYYLWHIYFYFFTLYPFMSHHPSQHSYLDYFAFLGLYSISSPISQSALSVNTIFNKLWFRSLVGRQYSVEKSHYCQMYDYR